MRSFFIAATILSVALSGGIVQAADQRQYEFTGTPNTANHLAGTFLLAGAGEGNGTVQLQPNSSTVWVSPTQLSAAAPFTNGNFGAQLYFSNPNGGNITVAWGYWVPDGATGGHFQPLKVGSAKIERVPRSVVPGTFALPTTGTDFDVGRAIVSVPGVTSEIPAHTFPAIKIISTSANTLYTQPSAFQATGASSATIPMPELSAVVLMSLGVVVIAGAVIYRKRQGWN